MQTWKLLAATVVAAGISAGARAGTITSTVTQTGTVAQQTTDFSNVVFDVAGGANATTFAGFNAALGTLTGVTITYSISGVETGSLTNTAAGSESFKYQSGSNDFVSADASTPSAVPSVLLNYADSTLESSNSSYTLTSGQTSSLVEVNRNAFTNSPLTISETLSAATDPSDVDSFIGTNFSVDLNTLSTSTFAGGGGNITTALSTVAGATLSIVYTYTTTTVAVPEPASMALLGIGLIGMTFLVRRRYSV